MDLPHHHSFKKKMSLADSDSSYSGESSESPEPNDDVPLAMANGQLGLDLMMEDDSGIHGNEDDEYQDMLQKYQEESEKGIRLKHQVEEAKRDQEKLKMELMFWQKSQAKLDRMMDIKKKWLAVAQGDSGDEKDNFRTQLDSMVKEFNRLMEKQNERLELFKSLSEFIKNDFEEIPEDPVQKEKEVKLKEAVQKCYAAVKSRNKKKLPEYNPYLVAKVPAAGKTASPKTATAAKKPGPKKGKAVKKTILKKKPGRKPAAKARKAAVESESGSASEKEKASEEDTRRRSTRERKSVIAEPIQIDSDDEE